MNNKKGGPYRSRFRGPERPPETWIRAGTKKSWTEQEDKGNPPGEPGKEWKYQYPVGSGKSEGPGRGNSGGPKRQSGARTSSGVKISQAGTEHNLPTTRKHQDRARRRKTPAETQVRTQRDQRREGHH